MGKFRALAPGKTQLRVPENNITISVLQKKLCIIARSILDLHFFKVMLTQSMLNRITLIF